jgi:hypothetical protein
LNIMQSWNRSFYVFGTGLLLIVAAACSSHTESGAPAALSGFTPATSPATSHDRTFTFTGTLQSFRVPLSVTKITVIAVGAQGGELKAGSGGGLPGRITATIPVSPGQKLAVFVGGQPSGVRGGFNGGADGGANRHGYNDGFGGGGASDVRENGDRLGNRIIVAGGGGGAGYGSSGYYYGDGGKGGGDIAGAGDPGGGASGLGGRGGEGGTQDAGGAGGSGGSGPSERNGRPGAYGTIGRGGAGGTGCDKGYFCKSFGGGGGGGGGGYYGGGGGGGGAGNVSYGYLGGGGGGGSSYITPSAIAFHSWKGWRLKQPNGLVVISW